MFFSKSLLSKYIFVFLTPKFSDALFRFLPIFHFYVHNFQFNVIFVPPNCYSHTRGFMLVGRDFIKSTGLVPDTEFGLCIDAVRPEFYSLQAFWPVSL